MEKLKLKKLKKYQNDFLMVLFVLGVPTLSAGIMLMISDAPYHLELIMLGLFAILLSMSTLLYEAIKLVVLLMFTLIKK